MGRATHAVKYFSSQTLLLCRNYEPAYKSYKTIHKMISKKYDKDYEELKSKVTCKRCLKQIKKNEGKK